MKGNNQRRILTIGSIVLFVAICILGTFRTLADGEEANINVSDILAGATGKVYSEGNSIYVSENDTSVTINGTVSGTLGNANVYWEISNTVLDDLDEVLALTEVAYDGTSKEFSITVPVSPDEKLNLYAISSDGQDTPTLTVKSVSYQIKTMPTINLTNGESKTIDHELSNYSPTVSIGYNVNNLINDSWIAYSDEDLSALTNDVEIIDELTGKTQSPNGTISYVLDMPKDKTVTLYLYKNNVILDKKTFSIVNELEINTFSLKGQESLDVTAKTVTLKKYDNSTSVDFVAEVRGYDKPFMIKWDDGNGNHQQKVEWNGEWEIDHPTLGKVKNYRMKGKISGLPETLPNGGQQFTIELYCYTDNQWCKIDEGVITVHNMEPTIEWDEGLVSPISGENDRILLNHSGDFNATVDEWKDGDKLYHTTATIENPQTYTGWNTLTEDHVDKESFWNPKYRMSISSGDMGAMYGETVSFYLVRNQGEADRKVFELGSWDVGYLPIENSWYSLGQDKKTVFEISDVDTAFYEPYSDKTVAKINGYYTNPLATDRIYWSKDTFATEQALIEWTLNPSTEYLHGSNNSDGNKEYNINIEGLTFANDDDEFVYNIYLRRVRENGTSTTYDIFTLGTVHVKKGHKPELVSADVTINNSNLDVSLVVEDEDLGVKKVEIIGKKTSYSAHGFPITDENYSYVTWTKDTIDPTFGDDGHPLTKNIWFNNTGDIATCRLEITDWCGNKTVIENAFAIMPKVSVSFPEGVKEGREDQTYTAASLNQDVTISVSKCEDAGLNISGAEETHLSWLKVKVETQDKHNLPLVFNKTYTHDEDTDTVSFNLEEYLTDENVPVPNDGKYKITVTASNARQTKSIDVSFIYDTDPSEILNVKVGGVEVPMTEDNDDYVYFSNNPISVSVTAKDDDGGVGSIDYFWLDGNGTKTDGSKEVTDNYNPTTVDIERNESFRSHIYVTATDKAGNKIMEDGQVKYYTIGGIIVDTPGNHGSESHVAINGPETGAKDANNKPLYNGAFDAKLVVTDNFSGIRSVEWSVNSSDQNGIQSGSMSVSNATISGDSWAIDGRDKNILTSVSKTIRVDGNSDNMSIYVKMTDNAGNTSETTYEFSIDNVKPVVTVTFDNATGDKDFNNYYAQDRVATIVVKDRNFDSSSFVIANNAGNKGTISGWTEKKDASNPDNNTYTATVTFKDDDRYVLSFSCKDKAGNSSDRIDVNEFVIDRVNPEVTVTFEGKTNANGYYSSARKATIYVKDANFERSRVAITGDIVAAGYQLSEWTRTDDGWVATMTVSGDGKYTFNVSATDKSGNKGNTVTLPSFIMDTTAPEILMEGVKDKSANSGKVAPIIKIKDTNADKNTVKVELSGVKSGNVDLNGWYTISEDGLEITFKNFKEAQEIDDLYTLKVTAKDQAGNLSVSTITFSVNRFGSIYYLSEDFQNINEKYVRKANGVGIIEINPDKLVNKTLVITLTYNGVPTVLSEGKDYTISADENDGDWKTYKYMLADSLFTKDGSYVITLTSEDEAGNKNNNVDKEVELKFGVDGTAPIIEALDFEANHFYSENGKDVTVTIKDNLLLDAVEIFVGDEKVEYTENGEEYTFHINESNRAQTIRISAKDMAGNEEIVIYEGILVSGNFFIRILHNKLAIILILGGVAVVGIGGTVLGFAKFGR